jgi:hypothetical protein
MRTDTTLVAIGDGRLPSLAIVEVIDAPRGAGVARVVDCDGRGAEGGPAISGSCIVAGAALSAPLPEVHDDSRP